MTKSDVFVRVLFFTLLILMCVVAIWQLSALNTSYTQHADYASKQYEDRATENIIRSCTDVEAIAFSDCVHKQIKSSKEHDRAERDLAAQQGMALWALIVAGISAGTLMLTGVGVWFIWKTAKYAEETLAQTESAKEAAWKTVEETKRIGEAQSRAYVFGTKADLTFKENEILDIKFSYKNLGNTPAYNVQIKCILEVYTDNPPTVDGTIHSDFKNITIGTLEKQNKISFEFKDILQYRKADKRVRITFEIAYIDCFGMVDTQRGKWEFRQVRLEFLKNIPTNQTQVPFSIENMTASESIVDREKRY